MTQTKTEEIALNEMDNNKNYVAIALNELLKEIKEKPEEEKPKPEHILNIGYELETAIKNDFKSNKVVFDEETERTIYIKNTSKEFKEYEKFINDKKFIETSDGSIHTSKGLAVEFNSRVYKNIKSKEDLNELLEDLKHLLTYIEIVNNSMGLHFHISFKNMSDYYTLLNFDFADKFFNECKKNFKTEIEKSRINNNFCKPYFDEKDFNKVTRLQLKNDYKVGRYKAVNYNSFNIHKTIEFRIFPSTKNFNRFKEYLYFLYDFIINYLESEDKKTNFEEEVLINKKNKKADNNHEKEIINLNENEILKELNVDILGV